MVWWFGTPSPFGEGRGEAFRLISFALIVQWRISAKFSKIKRKARTCEGDSICRKSLWACTHKVFCQIELKA